jgi:ADP-heptose:LPS heptosyltransferase
MIPAALAPEQLRKTPYVIVSPRSNEARRDWPLERFAQLCAWLVEQRNLLCIVTGVPKSASDFQSVFGLNEPRIIHAAGVLTFSEMIELLPHAALTVGNNSSLGHYAGYYDVPSLILFSASHSVSTWAPQTGRYICLQAQVPCRLCSLRVAQCDHDFLCMKALTLEMAKDACDQLLQFRPASC